MSTIKDTYDLVQHTCLSVKLWGADDEFMGNFIRKTQRVGAAMLIEFEVPFEGLRDLPPETPLGSQAQIRFDELKRWLLSYEVYYTDIAKRTW